MNTPEGGVFSTVIFTRITAGGWYDADLSCGHRVATLDRATGREVACSEPLSAHEFAVIPLDANDHPLFAPAL